MVSIFLGEIPTGAFADTLGRKFSITISLWCSFIYFLIHIPAIDPNFFFPAEIIGGLAFVFLSGALSAWIVDNLKYYGFQGNLEEVFSRANILSMIARLMGGFAGAYIGSRSLIYPWLGGTIGILLTIILVVPRMKEPYFTKKKLGVREGIESISRICKVSINYGIKHRTVFLLFITSLLFSFFCIGPNMYWQPKFLDLLGGEKIWAMGYINIIMSFAIIGGTHLSLYLLQKMKSRTAVLILTAFLAGFGIILAAIISNFFLAFFFFLFYEVGLGIRSPIYQSFLNENIPSKERATILSFGSVLNSAGAAFGLLVLGLVAKHLSISWSWFIAALILLSSVIPLTLLHKEEVRDSSDSKNL